MLLGKGEVAVASYDPIDGNNNTLKVGGPRWLSNTDGSSLRGYKVYQGETSDGGWFGKGGGLGDMELLCDSAPIEIGNRVWYDADSDGTQDPGEPVYPGITVRLYTNNGDGTFTLVGEVLTDADGHYLFTDANVTGGVQPNTEYVITLNNPADFNGGNGSDGLVAAGSAPASSTLTSKFTSMVGAVDLNDSDAYVNLGSGTATGGDPDFGGFPIIPITTGGAGENNHSYDFGFDDDLDSPTAVSLQSVRIVGVNSFVSVKVLLVGLLLMLILFPMLVGHRRRIHWV